LTHDQVEGAGCKPAHASLQAPLVLTELAVDEGLIAAKGKLWSHQKSTGEIGKGQEFQQRRGFLKSCFLLLLRQLRFLFQSVGDVKAVANHSEYQNAVGHRPQNIVFIAGGVEIAKQQISHVEYKVYGQEYLCFLAQEEYQGIGGQNGHQGVICVAAVVKVTQPSAASGKEHVMHGLIGNDGYKLLIERCQGIAWKET